MTRLALALGLLLPILATAQTPTIPASAAISWTLPTTATDSSPLTGALALTAINVWVSTSVIPDGTTAAPSITLAPTATSTTYTTTVANNSTLHVRVNACNVGGCSLMSAEVTKTVVVPAPGIPTGVTFTIQIKP